MAIVFFPKSQRPWVDGAERIEIDATRVSDLIRQLEARYPALAGKLDGAAVSIDGDIHNDASYQPLSAESEVHFVSAVAGG